MFYLLKVDYKAYLQPKSNAALRLPTQWGKSFGVENWGYVYGLCVYFLKLEPILPKITGVSLAGSP